MADNLPSIPATELERYRDDFDHLVKVIVSHLPDWGDRANGAEADEILRMMSDVETHVETWRPTEEARKIEKIRNLIGELSIAWEELHPRVEEMMIFLAVELKRDHDKPDALEVVQRLSDLVPILAEVLQGGLDEASKGKLIRSDWDWQAMSVMDVCRDMWARRNGGEAPIAINDESPFAYFVSEIFEVLGIESTPRSAMNARRNYLSKLD